MMKHVRKADKVDPGDRVTLPVKFACKPELTLTPRLHARVTLAQGQPSLLLNRPLGLVVVTKVRLIQSSRTWGSRHNIWATKCEKHNLRKS